MQYTIEPPDFTGRPNIPKGQTPVGIKGRVPRTGAKPKK